MPRSAAFLSVLAIPSILCARSWHVPLDVPTLAAALAQSAAGDSVLLAPGDYHEQGLVIGHGLTLAAADPAGAPVVLHADGQPILAVWNVTQPVILRDLVLRGWAGDEYEPALLRVSGSPGVVLGRCALEAEAGTGLYGLRVREGSNVAALECRFQGSVEPGPLHRVVEVAGLLHLADCTFTGFRGAGSLIRTTGSGRVLPSSCSFTDNVMPGWSAISIESNATPFVMEDCRFAHNDLRWLVDVDWTVDVERVLRNCQMEGNILGAGVAEENDDPLRLEDCLLQDNDCGESSALLDNPYLVLDRCTLAGNQGQRLMDGGGLYLDACLLAGNEVDELVVATWHLDVACTVSHGNRCGDWGGDLAPFAGQAGNSSANPLLRDLEGGDLRPALGSILRPQGNSCGILLGALDPVDEPPAPHARFQLAPALGLAPLRVDFRALDQGPATSWTWDFTGDGVEDAQGAQVEWLFTDHGLHPVTLTTSDGVETRQWTLEDAVTAGGRLLRVPEELPGLLEALAVALPGDTVELACGEWVLESHPTLPWGVVLRTAEPQCASLVTEVDFLGTAGIQVAAGPWVPSLEGLVLEGRSEEPLSVWGGPGGLVLRDCILAGRQTMPVGFGLLRLEGCRLVGLSNWIPYGFGARVVLVDCRLEDCNNLIQSNDSYVDLQLERCQLTGGGRLLSSGYPAEDRVSLSRCTVVDGNGLLRQARLRFLRLDRVIVVGGDDPVLGNWPIDTLQVEHTNIWGVAQGDWTGPLAPWSGQNGNLSVDPLFCDGMAGDFHLSSDSPCLLDDGQDAMGATSMGCDTALPQALFTATPAVGAPPLPVEFRNRSRGGVDTLEWDLDGDGATDDTTSAPGWIYDLPGTWRPRLTVRGPGGETTLAGLVRVGGQSIRVPQDEATVAEALRVAAPGDTVVVGCGVWHEHGLELGAGVVLRGEEAGCATLEGDGLGPLLTVAASAGETLVQGLVFSGGRAASGAAIRLDTNGPSGSSLRLVDCRFQGNRATGDGGAVAVESTWPRLVVEGCGFQDNQSGDKGGAIRAPSPPTLLRCSFVGNRASFLGGAVYTYLSADNQTVADSCLFVGNRAGSGGAAIHGLRDGHIHACTFSRDSTAATGGVIHLYDSQTIACGVTNSILASAEAGQAFHWTHALLPQLSCTDVWGHPGGDWTGGLASQRNLRGNLSLDPLFCAPDSLDFTLEEGSPCRAEASSCGGMGAVDGPCATELDPAGARPGAFALFPAVPNPFNPITTLRFRLERAGPARLAVHNLLGQRVLLLHDGVLPAGEHVRVLEAGPLASGVYVATLEAGGRQASRKLVVLK